MEYCVRYHIVDDENKVLKTFYGSVQKEKLKIFLDSLPTITKEETFPILNITRLNGKITCNLERYFKNESIKNKHYRILEYKVDEQDIDDKDFLHSESDCSTNAYNIYIKWEELPEIINYIEKIDLFGPHFLMDFSFVYQLLTQVNPLEKQSLKLLKAFRECFTFSEIDQISFDEIQFIFAAEQYASLQLKDITSFFRKAFENGKKNSQILLTNGRKETIDFEIIPVQTEEELLLEKMKSEKNAFGRYINFLEGISDMENVYQYHSNRSFSLNCLSDEGDLYTYQVLISFPKLYQFITYLNQNYKVIKEETFLELDWDCYENKPILSKVLAQDSAYCLLDFYVEKENIDIRTQKATNVYVKWEESVALFRYINTMVSSLTQRTQVDWSTIPEEFDALAVDKQEKKQLYYNFLSCFQFGDPIEIIPSHIVSQIEEHSPHPTLSLEQQKRILEKRKKLGIRNREFFALLLEKDMVSFPKQLVSKNAKF